MPSPMKLEQDRSIVNPTSTPISAKTVSYRKFEIEKNAKNKAYFFILSHNLLNEFAEFCKITILTIHTRIVWNSYYLIFKA